MTAPEPAPSSSAPERAADQEALTRRAYDLIAAHYDRFWGDRMTPTALRALGELVLPRLALPVERDPRALDLCCGTGQLAGVLAERGWDVVGVDSAPAMLDLARRHAPRARFVLADARDLADADVGRAMGEAPFDVCVSAFDSLNHVLTAEGLSAVFGGVFARLRPGGAFLFDLNTRRGFQERFQGGFDLADPELACRVEASYDAATGLGRYDVTLRPVAGAGATTQPGREAPTPVTVALVQRCHAPAEVVALLTAAGFEGIARHDAERALGMAGHVGRVFFSAWRPAAAPC